MNDDEIRARTKTKRTPPLLGYNKDGRNYLRVKSVVSGEIINPNQDYIQGTPKWREVSDECYSLYKTAINDNRPVLLLKVKKLLGQI